MTDWHFGYYFDTDIVGESNYQKALDKCYKDKKAYHKGNSAFVDVDLVYETNNAHDKNAVAVISEHGKIGYLSKSNAIRYRHLCDGLRNTLSVRCKVYKGKKGIYGAWVDLDLEDLPSTPQSLAKYKDIAPPPFFAPPPPLSDTESSPNYAKYLILVVAIIVIIMIVT